MPNARCVETGCVRFHAVEFIAANWRLAAVAALFFVGVAVRRAGFSGPAQGRWLLNFVFNVGLPILVFGALTGVPLAMGLLVSARGMRRPEVWTAVVLRSGLGGVVGLLLGYAFGLQGTAAAIAVVGGAAPVGFTAVVLAARENLDLDLAATAAAISVFLARCGFLSRWGSCARERNRVVLCPAAFAADAYVRAPAAAGASRSTCPFPGPSSRSASS
jgi:hypothetical protein